MNNAGEIYPMTPAVTPPARKLDVPLCRPSLGEEEFAAVKEVMLSGWMAHGPYNHKFEESVARYLGVPHAITMNSCTSALEAALKVAGIRGEVIIPSFTFVATANAVVTSGATPVFCDVDPVTRNVTADTIGGKITPKTEAVIIVHYGGQPCQMDAIVSLCEKHKLFLVEDSAETLGATWNGRQAGSFGVGCFSFFPTKNITTGEGGMLTCRDDAFAAKVRTLIAHGIASTTLAREKVERPWLRAAEMPGHNYRMSNMLAAIGYHQMQKLDTLNRKRVILAERYNERLAALSPVLKTPVTAPGATHVYQMYTVTVPAERRDGLIRFLKERGVGASVHFDPPVHQQPYYRDFPGALPATEALAQEIVTLPIFPDMTFEEQDWVIEALQDACAG
jgi:perosamine synthetase